MFFDFVEVFNPDRAPLYISMWPFQSGDVEAVVEYEQLSILVQSGAGFVDAVPQEPPIFLAPPFVGVGIVVSYRF